MVSPVEVSQFAPVEAPRFFCLTPREESVSFIRNFVGAKIRHGPFKSCTRKHRLCLMIWDESENAISVPEPNQTTHLQTPGAFQ